MRIGIDLGGTKIEAIGIAADGTEMARHRVATPHSYEGTVGAIVALVAEVERSAGDVGPVGIGIPGAIQPDTGLVKNANSVWLLGRPLVRDLAARLGRPVRAMNDANCFALSEATDGAGAGADVVFGVILGTGVGGGIVVHGRVLSGANLVAGEWGHVALPWVTPDELPGPACYCGQHGCVETWLSGPGFAADHARVTGQVRDPAAIVHAALAGDADAAATLARYHDRLGRALSMIVNILDPDVIVLGGGMSNTPGLAEAAMAALPKHVFAAGAEGRVATRMRRNLHGDSSGVRGAAWLWSVAEGEAVSDTLRHRAAYGGMPPS